jgi:hypothetical protein
MLPFLPLLNEHHGVSESIVLWVDATQQAMGEQMLIWKEVNKVISLIRTTYTFRNNVMPF